MRQAQQQKNHEAVSVVVEIKASCGEAERGDRRQKRFGNRGPAHHVGFDEPVQVMVGVDERQEAGDPRIEAEMRNAEHGAERRRDIAEVFVAQLGTALLDL